MSRESMDFWTGIMAVVAFVVFLTLMWSWA
jgi:hypothetical protein